jgi:AraC-like DNA-binding protein
MAAHANSLTERVTKPVKDGAHVWSMPARDVRVFVDTLGRLGYDVASLFASARLCDADLDDVDARIPCEALGALITGAQQQRFTPNIGLEVARMTPLGAYPLLDYLVVTSDTVGSGVQQLARYQRLVGNPIDLRVRDEGGDVRLLMADGAAPFSLEFLASLMVLHLRHETDGRFAVTSISFQHTPDDVPAFERVLGCTVRPASSWNGLTVPPDAWRLPLRRRDPILRQVLESHAEAILAQQPPGAGVALDVRRVLSPSVISGEVRIGALARQLGMSGRTLQRRLAAEGVSFQQLLDEARKEAAGHLLREQALAICEVAYLVGYSEPAPFHRAFRRWYGMTPELFRQKHRHRSGPNSSL